MSTTYNWFLSQTINENWSWQTIFTKEECDQIIKIGLSLPVNPGRTRNDPKTKVCLNKNSFIPTDEAYHWIFLKCSEMILYNNNQFFNYDIQYIETLQFGIYEESEKGFYGRHIDTQYSSNGTRKLSFSILLSDPSSYEGGELLLHYHATPHEVGREQGVAVIFPSSMLHEVTPVTKGIRYSLVGWAVGPRFK